MIGQLRTVIVHSLALALVLVLGTSGAQALDVEIELTPPIGGKGEQAGKFREPTDIAVDVQGRLHVVDSGNERVQVFEISEGVARFVTMYGDKVNSPELDEPWAIAAGPDGNLYVTDRGTGTIQVYAPTGQRVGVYATKGLKPGELSEPRGIALDSQGRIYVADTGNDRVSVFSGQGVFLHVINASWDSKAVFEEVVDVAVDRSDNLYVLDQRKARISVFDKQGRFVRAIDGRGLGFSEPIALSVDRSGTLVVLDGANQRIVHFGPNQEQFPPFGAKGEQLSQFDEAQGILLSDSQDRLFVADTDNNRVQVFRIKARELDKPLPEAEPTLEIRYQGSLNIPAFDLTIGPGELLYASLPDERKVVALGEGGKPKFDINPPRDTPGELEEPRYVLFADGKLYVTDHRADNVKWFNENGVYQFYFGKSGSDPLEFRDPSGLGFYNDSVYVADPGNDRIQILTAKGGAKQQISGSGNSRFDEPRDLVVGPDGSIYVTDTGNHLLRKLTPAGGPSFSKGGRGYGKGLFEEPRAVDRDNDGIYYVLDANGVQMFTENGEFVWRFGASGSLRPGNFARPTCLAVDARQEIKLYVCDPEQKRVEVFEIRRVPARPQRVKLEADLEQSTLSWNAPQQNFRKGFVIFGAASPEGPWRKVGESAESSFVLSYPLAGEPVTAFYVTAISHAGYESNPSDAVRDLYRQGVHAYESGDYAAAVAALDEKLVETPNHGPAMLYKGRALAGLDKLAEATNVLRDLERLEGWFARANLALAELNLEAGNIQTADDDIRRVLEQEPDNADALMLHAKVAMRKHLYEDAIERTNKVIQAQPDNVKAYLLLGDAYMAKGLPADARDAYLKAQQLEKGRTETYLKLANAFHAAGDTKNATKAIGFAMQIEKDNPELRIQAARFYYDTGDLINARGMLREAAQLNPKLPQVYYLLGRIAFDEGDFEKALSEFRKAAEFDPNDLDAQLQLGLAYQKLGKQSEAQAIFQKVIGLTPASAEAQLRLGRTFLKYGLYELALETFDKVQRLAPGNAEAPLLAGEAYFKLKRYTQAINKLEESLTLDPNNAHAHYMLGRTYLAAEMADNAVARLKLATFIETRQETLADYYFWLGEAYMAQKQYAKASEAYGKAREIQGGNAVYLQAYQKARQKASVVPASGQGPLEITEVEFKTVAQSQFKDLERNKMVTVWIKNNSGEEAHAVKVTVLAEGFMNFAAESFIRGIGGGQLRSAELKGKFNQAALELTRDTYAMAEIKIEYYFNKKPYRHSIYEPFLIRADLNDTSNLDTVVIP